MFVSFQIHDWRRVIKNVHLFTLYLQKGECAEKHLDGFGVDTWSTQENDSSTSLISYIIVNSMMH